MKNVALIALLFVCRSAWSLRPIATTHLRYPLAKGYMPYPAPFSQTTFLVLTKSNSQDGEQRSRKMYQKSDSDTYDDAIQIKPIQGKNRQKRSSKRSQKNPRSQKPRRLSSGKQKRNDHNKMLDRFRNGKEIDQWMNDIVSKQTTGTLGDAIPFPKSWSSRDETDFIRSLRDRGAYQALEAYAYNFAHQNEFVYTAAMSSLANSRNKSIRKRTLMVLDKMDETGVVPSSFTSAALFQSVDGPEEAKKVMSRLQQYTGKTSWSVEAFNQAIMACARRAAQEHPTNKSWQIALDFGHRIRREGLRPNLKTYTSLLHVCAQTGQVKIALSLLREIEGNPNLTPNARLWGAVLNVCAQAGDYKEANKILQTMQETGHDINLVHCSAFLKALSQRGQVNMSFQVLDMMNGLSTAKNTTGASGKFQMVQLPRVAPDLVALNTILASCAKAGDFAAARKLVDRMKDGEFLAPRTSALILPDEISYSLLLSSCSDPLAARGILKEMHLSRRYRVGVVRPSNITYARAIAVCGRANVSDVESALFFLDSARNDGIEPTVYMYSAAIWTAERSGNYSVARHILDEMKESGVQANSISFTGVISAAAKRGMAGEALALYEEMKNAGCSPTIATYNSLALAIRDSQAINKTETLEAVLHTMNDRDLYVSVGGPVIEALINEYGKIGSFSDAKRVFDIVKGPTNGRCLRAMLHACGTAHPRPMWEEAISMLHCSDITRTAVGPGEVDQGALSNAMMACAKADRWSEALNLLHLSSSISIVALNAVIAACGRKGRPDVAVSILNEMERKYGVRPDERTYRSAVIACNQAEHQKRRHEITISSRAEKKEMQNDPTFEWWECALALLRRMKEEDLSPDIQTFSSCISACEAAGQWQRALAILQSMIDDNKGQEKENFLNLFCFNAAISSCEKGGAWVEALEIYERMISYGGLLKPNFVTLSSLVLALANAGQKELAQSKYVEGIKMKIVNPWRTTKDSSGRKLKAMDLHKFNIAMASSAVRCFLDFLLSTGKESAVEHDLVIIVGKGLRSTFDPVLLPTIQGILDQEYGITASLDPDNQGRLVVDADRLRALVVGRSWR